MPPDFNSLALSPELVTVLAEIGYETPTPIQRQGIPVLLAGKDLIAQAKTGSGKTAAFALPLLQRLDLDTRAVQALVICPTRELCAQVAREFRNLGRRYPELQVLVVAGGQPIPPQSDALNRGVHIVVGTPGRLLDHLQRGNLVASKLSTVVLDEADRMLDMGFQTDVETILDALPRSRQTALFSATFPGAIEAMCRAHQQNAVRIMLDEAPEQAPPIRQLAVRVQAEDKLLGLYLALTHHAHESALVFCNFKLTVAELYRTLDSAGISVGCLHGDLEQFQRDKVLAKFRNHSIRILLATDVAARGLDVKDLDLVVNYELPDQPEIYVHRIGRTGRAGNAGLSISLATPRDNKKLAAIENFTGATLEIFPGMSSSNHDVHALAEVLARPARMATILISGGRKDKVRAGDILGALTGDAGGLASADIGKIEIHDRLSYVAVSKKLSRDAVKSLNQGRIKGKRFRASLV